MTDKLHPPPMPAEVRAARAFLQAHNLQTRDIHPRKFAAAAKEAGTGFQGTLKFISLLQAGGSEQQTYRMDLLRQAVASGK